MKRFLILFFFSIAYFASSSFLAGQTLVTDAATSITATSATLNGTVDNTGGGAIFDIKFEYGLTTSYGSVIVASPGFSSSNGTTHTANITGLTPETTYHYRFTGTNNGSTYYPGGDITFTTAAPTVPSVTTNTVNSVTSNSVYASGEVVSDGGSNVTVKGFCYSLTNNPPTISDLTTSNGTGLGSYGQTIPNLKFGTTYYLRAYATNNVGTSYGLTETFTTLNITQASDITFSNIQSNSISASYTSGTGGSRLVVVKEGSPVDMNPVDNVQYDANTIFGAGDDLSLNSGNFVVARGSENNNVNVTGLTAGLTYHFKVFEYTSDGLTNRDYRIDGFDEVTDNPNSQITLKPEPTTQASDISFTSTGSSEVSLNWAAGNGDGSMVVVRAEGTTEVDPVDFNDYAANTSIGSAATTGAGNFVVFKGLGTGVTVTGLSPETTYHFKVYEYNNEGALSDYKIDGYPNGTNPNSTTTLKEQPAQASELSFTNITENTMTVSWTTGGGDGAVLIAREASAIADFPIDGTTYTGDLAFGSGANLGNNTFVLYNGTATTADITGLTLGTTYHFMVCEYNNSGSNTDYNTTPGTNNPGSQSTLKTTPATQSSAIEITDIQANQFTLTWTNGDGENRVVLMKQGTAVNAIPADGTVYTANTVFGAGTQIGTGNYVVFNGSTNSATVTGLDANTPYYVKVFEYNNSGSAILFKTDGFSEFNPASAKTLPTLQADNLVFSSVENTSIDLSWTRGNGDSVLVVAKAGTTLTETPTEGTIYTDNATFGSGGTIATDVFVVYSGTGTSVSISGLTASTNYVFKAFEFNNSEPYTAYLNTNGSSNPATQSTTGTEPTLQASNVTFANTTSTQTEVSWTVGDGGGRIVLAYKGDTVSALPVDGTTYTASPTFGSGSEIGTGNFVVALGAVTTETVTGLTPESEYKFRVFEYSGSGSSINYLTSVGTDNPDSVSTLVGKPVTQAGNITFNQLNVTSYQVKWLHGSGDNLLVVAVAGAFTSGENPLDEIDYTANAAFGSGSPIGSGFVVYNGVSKDDSVIVTNLTTASNYSFKVFEYNTIGLLPYYQTADGTDNPMSRSTLATEPTTQAGAVSFTSVGATQVTLDWTNMGDGSSVIVVAREAADISSHPVDGTSYNGNNSFTAAEIYDTDYRVVSNGIGTGATITNLNPNTVYYFRAYGYNGTATTSNYLTSLGNSTTTTTIKTEPTLQAGNFSFTSLATTSYTVNWERGNGDGVLLVASENPITEIPADGNDSYMANAIFGDGSEIALASGIYAIYKGTAATVDVSGLTSASQYYFRAFEYNNTGTEIDYLATPDNSASQFTLSTEPATQVSAFTNTVYNDTISLAWTNGTGTGRIILAKHNSLVDAVPTDGIAYTANAVFGTGSEIGAGNYVVYAGNQPDTVRITGLLASETYYFQAFEYDNTGAINYNLTTAPTTFATAGTKGAPSVQASEINFTSLATGGFTINWTSGNGENRIVVMREGDQGTISNPTDNTTYTASSNWSLKGTELGTSSGYYTVYKGSGSSVSVSNLAPNTTYWVQVFEYNNPEGFETYNVNGGTNNPASQTTLKTAPSMQASGITSGTITSNSIAISWTSGNGANRIALINTFNSFSAYDGLDPLADANYSGSGEQVVYNGSGNTVTVSGLTAGTTYWFKVLEYNNTETNTLYHSSDTTDNPVNLATLGTATWVGTTTDWLTDGNWSPASTPTAQQSVVISTGQSAYPVLSSSHTVDNMVIEAGANITIADGVQLNITRDLLLESPSSSGASGALVIPGTGTISVGGTSTMQRYNPTPLSRHLLSFPTSPNINVFTEYYVYAYNEPTLGWSGLVAGSSIAVMQGLNVWDGPNMLTFTGTFNNGNQSINVTNNSPGDGSYGWNLVGNPYPSTIDWDAASGWTLNNVDATAYYYNGSSYTTFNSGTGTGTGGGTQYIAAGQGFFVHASANGSLGVSNAVRVTNTQNLLKSLATNKQLIRIETSGNTLKSDAALVFYSDATDDFDASYDAFKLMGDNAEIPEVYFINQTDQIAINTFAANKLDELNETSQLVFPLGLSYQTSGVVKFSIAETLNIPSEIYIYVFDALTNSYTNLREGNYELFISQQTNYIEDRFELVLSKNILSINDENLALKIWSFAREKTIFIKSNQLIKTYSKVYLYDITGRLLTAEEWNGKAFKAFKVQASGTYIIKMHVGKNIITQKVVVQ